MVNRVIYCLHILKEHRKVNEINKICIKYWYKKAGNALPYSLTRNFLDNFDVGYIIMVFIERILFPFKLLHFFLGCSDI